MSYKLNLEKNWEEEEDEEDEEEEEIDEEENNKLAISPYNNKNYYNDLYSGINKFEKKGYNLNFTQSKMFHRDGREYQSKLNYTTDELRKVVPRFIQTKTDLKKDFDLINQTKSYEIRLILKDTHYYNIQRVIPKDYYVNNEIIVEECNIIL
jgi:hypothetical protein